MVALVPAADAYQPDVPALGRKFGHQDVSIHEPVRGYLLHHHGQRFRGHPQVFSESGQQLRSCLHPVLAGLRKLDQLGKIVDELPQVFIHAQTLPAPDTEAGGTRCPSPHWTRPGICGQTKKSPHGLPLRKCWQPVRTLCGLNPV